MSVHGKADSFFFEDIDDGQFNLKSSREEDMIWSFDSHLRKDFYEEEDLVGCNDDVVVPTFVDIHASDDDAYGSLSGVSDDPRTPVALFPIPNVKSTAEEKELKKPLKPVSEKLESRMVMQSAISVFSSQDTYQNNTDGTAQTWTRREALERYRLKKSRRCFKKKIRYHCRKRIASDRPRVGGRFARSGEEIDCNQFVSL